MLWLRWYFPLKPTFVRDQENLKRLDQELTQAGYTIVYKDDNSFTAYKDGRARKHVRVNAT